MKNTTQIFNKLATTVKLDDGNLDSLDIDQFQKASAMLLEPIIDELGAMVGHSTKFSKLEVRRLIEKIKGVLGNEN